MAVSLAVKARHVMVYRQVVPVLAFCCPVAMVQMMDASEDRV
jgi:hypothetical protein